MWSLSCAPGARHSAATSHEFYLTPALVAQLVKNPPAIAGDTRDIGSIPGSVRFPGGENGNPLQYFCPESSMERGAWQATVHGVAKSQTQLGVCAHTHTHTHTCKVLFKAGVPSFVWQVGKQRLREGNKLILQTRVTNSFNCEWENSGRILKSQRFYPEISPRTGPRLVISKL